MRFSKIHVYTSKKDRDFVEYHKGLSFVGNVTRGFIPKHLTWFFRQTAALFRQIRMFPQLFRFCSDLWNSGIRQIVRNSMLTGQN